jgi:hypothetical protein
MRWWLFALCTACAAKVAIPAGVDGGLPSAPTVADVEPAPGEVPENAQFTITFSAPMSEGQLVAGTGRSETVVLAAEDQVEQVAAAISHDSLTAFERTLLVPAWARIGEGHASLTLLPDAPLAAGNYFLLVSARLKDEEGDKLQGNGARFAFSVEPPAAHATLIVPPAGAVAPSNLAVVRASAAGNVALVASDGTVMAAAQANGEVALTMPGTLVAGASYFLSLDGAVDSSQGFTVGSCPRSVPPALENGAARLSVRDASVVATVTFDWPVELEVQVGDADQGDPCAAGSCLTVDAAVSCAPPPCGPQAFVCTASVAVPGLVPASRYALRILAKDDFGSTLRGPVQLFSTLAPLPRLLISEVMATPSAPQTAAEYIELVNLGPGAALLDGLSFLTADGTLHALSGVPPPTPVLLAPGERAIAAGATFDASRYPSLPAQVPVLRAATQRLLSRGLGDTAPQPFQLMAGTPAVELASFPGGALPCAPGQSLQRDETVPPDADAGWSCGTAGGTPGLPP